MRYPKHGGYGSYLSILKKNNSVKLNKKIKKINLKKKEILLDQGKKIKFSKLVSTIPLPEFCQLTQNIPSKILKESNSPYSTKIIYNYLEISTKNLVLKIVNKIFASELVFRPSVFFLKYLLFFSQNYRSHKFQ